MSGETGDVESGWTTDTLRYHLTEKIAQHDRRYEERFVGQERAISIATAAINLRLDGMNEFRGSLQDQTAQQITRVEVAAMLATAAAERHALEGKVDALENWRARATGAVLVLGLFSGAVGAVVGWALRG